LKEKEKEIIAKEKELKKEFFKILVTSTQYCLV
jgi:hypothetical protein